MPTFLTIEGVHVRDEHHREVTMRGINVASNMKLPAHPKMNTHTEEGFWDGDNVSFVGRPFTVQDADVHFKRLQGWGYNTIRYLFNWEAIESRGPGVYDEEFIQHTIEVLRVAKKYDMMVFMDPHQDIWSRYCGGSGAPMWTVYACGLNPKAFAATEAALIQNLHPEPENYPKMIWATNYTRLACLTIFTMFFGGRQFTPKCIINGKNIQDFLQDHYIAAVKHLAQRIHEAGDLEDCTVIGWESLNEPNRGLIGYHKLSEIPSEQKLQKGTSPTAWQAILLGSGRAQEVEVWDMGGLGPKKIGKQVVDPKGVSAWLPEDYDEGKYGFKRDPGWKLGECVWAQHGVWDPSTDTLLKDDYFGWTVNREPLDAYQFVNTFFMDHYRKYAKAIRSIHKNAILFCQPPVLEIPPIVVGTDDEDNRMIYAPHFYDGITLMTKSWNRFWNVDVLGVLRGRYWSPAFAVKIGETAIRNSLRDQLSSMKKEGLDNIGPRPCVFTEIGAPFDMDDKYAYRTGDYISQIRALDANHFALEGAGVGYTLWTYCPDNDHQWGDQWNGEDFSIISLDDNINPSASPSMIMQSDESRTSLDKPDAKNEEDPQAVFHARNINTPTSSSDTITSAADSAVVEVAGSRAAEAFIRPSPVFTHGTVISAGFTLSSVTFDMKLEAPSPTPDHAPTVIYVPAFHFPLDAMNVDISGGKWDFDTERQYVKWYHGDGEQTIKITGIKVLGGVDDQTYVDSCVTSCSVM